jgi:hypothetical protein
MKPSATKTMIRLTTFARAANGQGSIATRSIAVQQLALFYRRPFSNRL